MRAIAAAQSKVLTDPAAWAPNGQVVSHDCELIKETISEPSTPASCEAKADGGPLPITKLITKK